LTINNVVYSSADWGLQYVRFFRIAYRSKTTTNRLLIFSDCVVSEIEFSAAENAEMTAKVSISARRFDIHDNIGGEEVAINYAKLNTKNTLALNTMDLLINGGAILSVVDDVKFTMKNNMLAYVGNADLPQKLIKRGWQTIDGSFRGEWSDEMKAVVDVSRQFITSMGTGNMPDMVLDFKIFGVSYLKFYFCFTRFLPIDHPEVAGEVISPRDLKWEINTDGVQTNPYCRITVKPVEAV
jgi:hypothetical protein